MSVGSALAAATRDLYRNGWRLVLLNTALAALALAVAAAASYAQPALLLLVVLGPFVAALVHCAITVQETEEVTLKDAVAGLRRHWRRGLALGALAACATALAGSAVSFWGRLGVAAWPFAIMTLYVALLFGVWQIHVWPLAVARRGDSLRSVFRAAAAQLARRPAATVALAVALLAVNTVGAIGVLPVLTLTIAYSTLAAVHFVLPPPPEEASS